jgi:hypothetical protein
LLSNFAADRRPVAAVVAHDKAGMRRGGSVLYVGLEFSRLQYALSVSGTAFCEDVGPFQSSKTKAAEAAFFLGADAPLINCSITALHGDFPALGLLLGQHHLTNNTCTSDLLPSVAAIIVAGIVIVDLPTWLDHEQEKSNASPGYHCEHDKKCFHDV